MVGLVGQAEVHFPLKGAKATIHQVLVLEVFLVALVGEQTASQSQSQVVRVHQGT